MLLRFKKRTKLKEFMHVVLKHVQEERGNVGNPSLILLVLFAFSCKRPLSQRDLFDDDMISGQ